MLQKPVIEALQSAKLQKIIELHYLIRKKFLLFSLFDIGTEALAARLRA